MNIYVEIIYGYMYFVSKDREKEEQEVPGWEGVHRHEEQQQQRYTHQSPCLCTIICWEM